MKKTVLDDNAYIYQRRDEETEQQKWQRMDKRQKIQYFLDYYLLKIVIALIMVGIVSYVLWGIVRPKDQTILYVAVVDEQLDDEKKALLTEELNQIYQVDKKRQKVVIDDLFYTQDGALDKLQIFLYNHQIDVIIAEKDTYEKFAGYGFFQNLETLLDNENRTRYEKYFCYASGYKELEEVSFDDHETGQGEMFPYGIDLSRSQRFTDIKNYIKNPIFSIVSEGPNPDHALEFLNYMMDL